MVEKNDGADVLLRDGVRYIQHSYSSESELEEIVIEHGQELFGENAILFKKKRLKGRGGVGSIPDAFVVDIDKKVWHIIEVELESHPLFDHVVN